MRKPIVCAAVVAAVLAAEVEGLAASHGIAIDAGYSSYLVPARRRGLGVGLNYRCLFLGDLGVRASGFVSRHVELTEGDEVIAPETNIFTGSLGLVYLLDAGPVSPVLVFGGTVYNGGLLGETRVDYGYFAAAGVEFPLSTPLNGGFEVGYFSQRTLSEDFPAYLLILFRVTWTIGTEPQEISKI